MSNPLVFEVDFRGAINIGVIMLIPRSQLLSLERTECPNPTMEALADILRQPQPLLDSFELVRS